MPTIPYGAPRAFHVMAKPTGAACNLACTYCFFLSKDALYPGSPQRMSDEVLEAYVRQVLESHRGPEVALAWQGGEPTLMGLDFFRRAVELAERYRRPDQAVSYTIQTNGTLLDDQWAAFFQEHGFLVGLSLDGPREMHDAYRVAPGGQGTWERVLRGWEVLQRHGVDTNILCCVHAANADHPLEVYRFFRDELGARYLQFIPIVERVTAETRALAEQGWGERPGAKRPLYTQRGRGVTSRSVKPLAYGRFLADIFDEWVGRDVGEVFVQMFDVTLGSFVGQHNLCVFAPRCGTALALEPNGDLYACDHYVEPDYRLGNILETPLIELVASEKQRRFGRDKWDRLPDYCRRCDVLFACQGECPRNRFLLTPGRKADGGGQDGLNYLCEGYRHFFRHVREPMTRLADLVRQGRPAAEIMDR